VLVHMIIFSRFIITILPNK